MACPRQPEGGGGAASPPPPPPPVVSWDRRADRCGREGGAEQTRRCCQCWVQSGSLRLDGTVTAPVTGHWSCLSDTRPDSQQGLGHVSAPVRRVVSPLSGRHRTAPRDQGTLRSVTLIATRYVVPYWSCLWMLISNPLNIDSNAL